MWTFTVTARKTCYPAFPETAETEKDGERQRKTEKDGERRGKTERDGERQRKNEKD